MNHHIAIGVDVGGSHITSAAVDLDTLEIISGSTFSVNVDNKAEKDEIVKKWSHAINSTIERLGLILNVKIGFAMPGPFNYRQGIALFEGSNDKYEKLFNVSIPEELSKYLNTKDASYRFLNDATSFAVGASAIGKAKNCRKIIALTLGTGFGSAFIENGIPLIDRLDVAKNGCLWDKPFINGIADDYFSTRWCLLRYEELSGHKTIGVKEIVEQDPTTAKLLFDEFGDNMGQFLLTYLKQFQPELVVIGGNIAKASHLFLPKLKHKISDAGLDIDIEISTDTEDAAIIGSAKLFHLDFWNAISDDIPTN